MIEEDKYELSEKAKKEIRAARKEVKEGRYIPHECLKSIRKRS